MFTPLTGTNNAVGLLTPILNASNTTPPSVKLLQAGDLPDTPELVASASISADSTRPSTPDLPEELPEMLLFQDCGFDEVNRKLSKLKLESDETSDEDSLEPLGLSLNFAF